MKPHEKLRRYWGDGVPAVKLEQASVTSLEEKYAIHLPGDFREYLLQSCPANEDACDNNFTFWWPLKRIKTIAEECDQHAVNNLSVALNAHKYLFFADGYIWCWAWAIACGEDEDRGRIVVVNGINDPFVANNLAEFVDRYIEDATQLA